MRQALACCALILACWPAWAQQIPDGHRFALTPFIAYRAGGDIDDRDSSDRLSLDDSSALGLVLGIPWTPASELEFYYGRQSTGFDTSGLVSDVTALELDFDTLQIGGTYFLDADGPTRSFIVATAGGTRIKPSAPGARSDTFFSFGIGGGWHLFANTPIGVRVEARALGTLIDSSTDFLCGVNNGSGGCIFNTTGDILWQFEAQAGLIFRF